MKTCPIIKPKVIHTNLVSVFYPFYNFFKTFGFINYTITVNKSSRNFTAAVSITKWDLFKFMLITMNAFALTIFNISCNFHISKHIKSILLLVGMRSIVAGGLVFTIFCMISEVVNRHKISVFIEQLNEIDDEVSSFFFFKFPYDGI